MENGIYWSKMEPLEQTISTVFVKKKMNPKIEPLQKVSSDGEKGPLKQKCYTVLVNK